MRMAGCIFTRKESIRNVFLRCEKSNYKNYEIIIVENNSRETVYITTIH